jgi:hypothetical protein
MDRPTINSKLFFLSRQAQEQGQAPPNHKRV